MVIHAEFHSRTFLKVILVTASIYTGDSPRKKVRKSCIFSGEFGDRPVQVGARRGLMPIFKDLYGESAVYTKHHPKTVRFSTLNMS